MGVLAATYCLENQGTQGHVYDLQTFIARFRENFDDHGELDQLL
jgi:adenosine kinase